jgi:hypothetical protein
MPAFRLNLILGALGTLVGVGLAVYGFRGWKQIDAAT